MERKIEKTKQDNYDLRQAVKLNKPGRNFIVNIKFVVLLPVGLCAACVHLCCGKCAAR